MFPSLRGTPRRDAEALEKALRSAGVAKKNITTLYDLDYQSFFAAIYNFRQALGSEDSAIFYYSGHGFSIDDHAFLVPVDFKLGSTRRSAELKSVSLDQVKKDLSKARMRALIIDACRTDIPLLKQASGSKSAFSLANLYDTKPAGTGELIVFATQGGKPAIADAPADGLSFFTYYFAKRFEVTLPDLGTVVRQAQIATAVSSNHSQEPDVRDNLQGYLQFPTYADKKPQSSLPTQPSSTPPTNVDYDAMLPLTCSHNSELLGNWQLGDGAAIEKYAGPSPVNIPFTVQPAGGVLPVPVNRFIKSRIRGESIQLTELMKKQVDSLFLEIDAASTQLEPLRGPNGPIELRRSYMYIQRNLQQFPNYLDASYTSFAGSVLITTGYSRVTITDLSRPMRDFISQLDQLGAERMDQACESAVRSITGATQ
jgi:hypothetical protein